MNREEFISYIKDPSRLDKDSLPEMNELVQDFPYFQSGHLLFLRNLRNLDHIRLGSQLKKSSVRIGNREVLYELLHGLRAGPGIPGTQAGYHDLEAESTPKSDATLPAEEPPVGQEVSGRSDEMKDETPAEIAPEPGTTGDADNSAARDALLQEIRVRLEEIQNETIDQPSPEESKTTEEQEGFKPGDAVTAGDPSPDGPATEETDTGVRTNGDLDSGQVGSGDDVLMLDEKWSIETITRISSEEKLPVEDETRSGDLLDLDYPENDAETEIQEARSGETDPAIPNGNSGIPEPVGDVEGPAGPPPESESYGVDEKRSFVSWFDVLGHSVPEEGAETGHTMEDEKSLKIEMQRQLIDDFISSDPRIPPAREERDTEDISKDSVLEKDGLFTETLARIYIKQGYYSKAIFIYRELSLKFPEKSSYFARQISEIENRIKDL